MRQDWMLFLTKIGTTRIYRAGENIFLQGERSRNLIYLEKGLALTYFGNEDGRERA